MRWDCCTRYADRYGFAIEHLCLAWCSHSLVPTLQFTYEALTIHTPFIRLKLPTSDDTILVDNRNAIPARGP